MVEGPKNIEDIDVIEVTANPLLVRLCNVRHPETGMQTIFSLYHGCAVALVHGRAGTAEFSDKVATLDPRVREFRDKVVVVHQDSKMRDDEVLMTFKSYPSPEGAVSSRNIYIKHATGSVNNPMSEASALEGSKLRQ